jgi:hypothetical protein
MPPRADPQQQRVYAAEAVLATHARRFTSLDEARAFVAAVFDDDDLWDVADAVDDPHVELEHRLRRWDAVTDGRRIRLSPTSGMDAATVLHEVAHVLTMGDEHGPVFCGTYLWLVRRWMGFHAYVDLRRAFHDLQVVVEAAPEDPPVRWAGRRRGAGPATP